MAATLAHQAFWFLRHGETDWNARGVSQGNVDIPLNEIGLAQAAHAARLLVGHGIASIVASPLIRARVTAEIVAEKLGVAVEFDARLREASYGVQEGQEMGDWFADWVAGTYTPEKGESFPALQARAVPAINDAVARPPLVLVVAHGALFRALRHEMGLVANVRTANGVPILCDPTDAGWVLTPLV